MTMRLFPIYLFAFTLFLTGACTKDTTEIIELAPSGPTLTGETVVASFSGRITASDGNGIAGVSVAAGPRATVTDAEGRYVLSNTNVLADQAYLTFRADGYVLGSRTVLVTPGGTYADVDAELLSLRSAANLDATAGGTVRALNSQASVVFPTGAMAATGPVTVAVHHLDPGSERFAAQMPGDLRSVDSEGRISAITTFGIVSTVIRDQGGQKIDLSAGKTATITIPVSATNNMATPSTIPLWYFDESRATWVEEGSATLSGGVYVGQVSHFTFWAVALRGSAIKLCGQLFQEEPNGTQTPAAQQRVFARTEGLRQSVAGTDAQGRFCGIVPADAAVTIFTSTACDGLIELASVPPSTSDVQLGRIVYTAGRGTLIQASGRLVCSAGPVDWRSAYLTIGGSVDSVTVEAPIGRDGRFQIGRSFCYPDGTSPPDSVDLALQYYNPLTAQTEATYIRLASEEVDLGEIAVCPSTPPAPPTGTGSSSFAIVINGDTTAVGDSLNIRATDRGLNIYGITSTGEATIFEGLVREAGFPQVGTFIMGGNAIFYPPNSPDFRYSLNGVPLVVTEYLAAESNTPGKITARVNAFETTGPDGQPQRISLFFSGPVLQ